MKNCLLVLMILCGTLNVGSAQKIRFTDTTNRWTLFSFSDDDATGTHGVLAYKSDSIINGVRFRRFYNDIGVREDTVLHRLYFRFLSNRFSIASKTDTVEHLFFDYTILPGDTLRVDYDKNHFSHVVKKIDSIRISGFFYRVWNMANARVITSDAPETPYQFVEAIGALNGPLFSIGPVIFEGCTQLRCFSNRGVTTPCSPTLALPCWISPNLVISGDYSTDSFDNAASCRFRTVAVANISGKNSIVVAPNPGNGDITLTMPASILTGIIQISDCTGRVLQKFTINDRKTAIGQYLGTPGVYYYTLQDAATGQRYTGRFVFR